MKNSFSRDDRLISVYESSLSDLRRFLLHRLGNVHEAEDVAHDAFVKLFTLSSLGDVVDVRKYLFKTSVRMAQNIIRRRVTERKVLLLIESNACVFSQQDNSSHLCGYIAGLDLDRVNNELDFLPERTKEIFLLHRLSGKSYKEISVSLGVSSRAVEFHISSALKRIKQAVQ